MSISREEVRWVYKVLLDREPESVEIVDRMIADFDSVKSLRRMFFSSEEFQSINKDLIRRLPRIIDKSTNRYQIKGKKIIDVSIFEDIEIEQSAYEEMEVAFIAKHLREGDVFLDIGGGRGIFSMIAASCVGATGQVYTFEADPRCVSLIERNARENGVEQRINIVQGTTNTQSLGKDEDASNITCIDASTIEIDIEAVVKNILEDVFNMSKRIHFVKIDLHGADLLAIAELHETLLRDRPLVLSKIDTDRLARVSRNSWQYYFGLMANYGYKPHILDENGLGRTHTHLEFGRAYSVVFSTTGHFIG